MKKETNKIPNEVTMVAFRKTELMERDADQKLYTDMNELMHNLNNYIDDCTIMQDYRGRDPKRIHSLLVKLEEAWKAYPDLRFGQFMTNFFYKCGRDPFYIEDDIWMEAIQAYIDGKDPGKTINDCLDRKYNRQQNVADKKNTK